MTIIICGAEEPLSSNPQLYGFDEDRQAITLATYSSQSLNRYSFVPRGPAHDLGPAAVILLKRIILALQTSGHWIIAWQQADKQRSLARVRTLASRLHKTGWQMAAQDQIGIAMKGFSAIDPAKLEPPEIDGRISGWAIVLAGAILPERLLEPSAVGTIRLLANNHRMQPSESFLQFLAGERFGLAYLSQDSAGRSGLVVIAPASLEITLQRFMRDGLVSEVLTGPAAPHVWTQA